MGMSGSVEVSVGENVSSLAAFCFLNINEGQAYHFENKAKETAVFLMNRLRV
jgi:glyoxylate utilization-related uncharacterized protein